MFATVRISKYIISVLLFLLVRRLLLYTSFWHRGRCDWAIAWLATMIFRIFLARWLLVFILRWMPPLLIVVGWRIGDLLGICGVREFCPNGQRLPHHHLLVLTLKLHFMAFLMLAWLFTRVLVRDGEAHMLLAFNITVLLPCLTTWDCAVPRAEWSVLPLRVGAIWTGSGDPVACMVIAWFLHHLTSSYMRIHAFFLLLFLFYESNCLIGVALWSLVCSGIFNLIVLFLAIFANSCTHGVYYLRFFEGIVLFGQALKAGDARLHLSNLLFCKFQLLKQFCFHIC